MTVGATPSPMRETHRVGDRIFDTTVEGHSRLRNRPIVLSRALHQWGTMVIDRISLGPGARPLQLVPNTCNPGRRPEPSSGTALARGCAGPKRERTIIPCRGGGAAKTTNAAPLPRGQESASWWLDESTLHDLADVRAVSGSRRVSFEIYGVGRDANRPCLTCSLLYQKRGHAGSVQCTVCR